MIGLSVCHVLSLFVERRRLLIVFFIATTLALALVPATYEQQRSCNKNLYSHFNITNMHSF